MKLGTYVFLFRMLKNSRVTTSILTLVLNKKVSIHQCHEKFCYWRSIHQKHPFLQWITYIFIMVLLKWVLAKDYFTIMEYSVIYFPILWQYCSNWTPFSISLRFFREVDQSIRSQKKFRQFWIDQSNIIKNVSALSKKWIRLFYMTIILFGYVLEYAEVNSR